jgi:hypothetical protein
MILFVVPGQLTLREQARRGVVEIKLHNEYSPAENLGELIRESDVVVRGVVISGETRVIGETDIVTDFAVQVLESLRARSKIQGTTVTVRQPGGAVVIDGRTIRAVDDEFPPLLPSEEYVLFLSRLPSGMYAATRGAQSVFQVTNGGVSQLPGAFSVWRDHNSRPVPIQSFRELIREAAPD